MTLLKGLGKFAQSIKFVSDRFWSRLNDYLRLAVEVVSEDLDIVLANRDSVGILLGREAVS